MPDAAELQPELQPSLRGDYALVLACGAVLQTSGDNPLACANVGTS
jgi:hypothetical protein